MTVRELIEKLQQENQDLEVVVETFDYGNQMPVYDPIRSVTYKEVTDWEDGSKFVVLDGTYAEKV